MKLNILGCHSATPLENAHTTSQVLEVKEHLFLIDCGEGTQIQLRNQKIKFSRKLKCNSQINPLLTSIGYLIYQISSRRFFFL